MSFWRRLFGTGKSEALRPQRLDYLNEAMALERQGDFEAALTSYRLALRDNPNDPRILQSMAIAFAKTGQPEEAIRFYRRALQLDGSLSAPTTGSRSASKPGATFPKPPSISGPSSPGRPRAPMPTAGCNTRRSVREIETEAASESS